MRNHYGVLFYFPTECRYCVFERYAVNGAIRNLYQTWGLKLGDYTQDFLDIQVIIFKIRWLLRGGSKIFFNLKKTEMITQVTNSSELRQALNENLNALLTSKRKLLLAKEVNNTLGKILSDVKMELMHNAITGEKKEISWFKNQKQLK